MKNYYVVGNKSSKSLSPIIFNHWFKKYKIDAKYSFIEVSQKKFDKKIIETLADKRLGGLNITIPFKQRIMKYIEICDEHSLNINAVNCIHVNKKIKGFNTDWIGYYKTLPKIKNIKKKNILIIGYGGAALAIHYVLSLKGFKNISIINRTKKKLRFEKTTKYTISIKKLDKFLTNSEIIINTTPKNPIKKESLKYLSKKTLLSDIVYFPKNTDFLKNFPDNKKIYGISMLLEQAASCFRIWFGFNPVIDRKLIQTLDKKIQ